jgi:hypothetical protein
MFMLIASIEHWHTVMVCTQLAMDSLIQQVIYMSCKQRNTQQARTINILTRLMRVCIVHAPSSFIIYTYAPQSILCKCLITILSSHATVCIRSFSRTRHFISRLFSLHWNCTGHFEVRMGRNFRRSPGPDRRAFGLDSKFIIMYVFHTPPKLNTLLFRLEWSPIYLQFALTTVSLIFLLLMHKRQQSLSELFNDAQRTSEVILAFEKLYEAIGCQVC